MWIYTVAPEWAIHAILAVGICGLVAAFVLSTVTIFSRYSIPLKVVGALLTALGLYLEGGLSDYKEWQFKIAEMKVKLAEAEVKAAQKNVEIVEKIVVETQVVKERGRDIIKYIDRVVTQKIPVEVPGPEREKIVEVIKFVENCPVPRLVIEQHNRAAQPPVKDTK